MNLKIQAPSRTVRNTKIYLDEKEITGVFGVSVDLSADSINTAVIEFYPSEIEIEGDFDVKTTKKITKMREGQYEK
jgi:hypothetical protein